VHEASSILLGSRSKFAGRRGNLAHVKRDGARLPITVGAVALLCVVVAIGAGLEGQFFFAGPLWTPGKGPAPVISLTPRPQGTVTPGPDAKHTVGAAITISILPILIILGCLVIAILALFVLYVVRHRVRRMRIGAIEEFLSEDLDKDPDDQDADLPALHRGLLRASDVLESTREPRDAIVRAWMGLQEAAEDSGVRRRPAETPTEFTTRVFESVDADRGAAAALLRVYLRVRFRAQPATQSDVVVAREAIARLQKTWPVRTPE
jgi:hypothetical protein